MNVTIDNKRTILDISKPLINHTPVNDGILSILGLTEHGKDTAFENFIEILFAPKLGEHQWVEFGEHKPVVLEGYKANIPMI